MKNEKWIFTGLLGVLLASSSPAPAQDHDHDNGHGKGRDKHYEEVRDGDRDDYHYKHHEEEIRGWYTQHEAHLPPGLAKRDRLPPGLEKQLVVRGTLPPGLQKRLYPCPEELEHRLPPPPPDCAHVFIGGHIVLLNRKTNVVVDIFHFEIN